MASTAPRRRKMSPAMIMQVLYPVALESKPASQIVPVEREKPSADFTCEPHATTGIAEPRPTVEDGGLVSHRRSLLSEGVLSNDLVAANGEKVTAENIDASAIAQSARQPPLRNAVVIGDDEVMAIAPVRVGHRVEHISERGLHLVLADEPTAMRLVPAGGVEDAIVSEQTHQALDVVAVPCISVRNEQALHFLAVHIVPPGVPTASLQKGGQPGSN